MKRFLIVIAGLLIAGMFLPLLAQQQGDTLADAARKARANQSATPAKHVYTNDNLPKDSANLFGAAAAPAKDSKNAKDAKDGKEDKKDAGDAAVVEFRKHLAELKKNVADLAHEIDLMQREQKVKTAVAYADAGNRLRDDKKFTADEQKYRDDLADRQKKLAEAQKALDDYREQGRKSGLPASALE